MKLPYKIAVLCYVFDPQGRVLLLHRRREPNQDLYSPIGGKLDQASGESPTACAIREMAEEAQIVATADQLHLTGIVSESGYLQQMHWLMFLYELRRPVQSVPAVFDEGTLEWHDRENIGSLPIPETDREIIWPLFWRYRTGFFAVHIDCKSDGLIWRLEQAFEPDRKGAQ